MAQVVLEIRTYRLKTGSEKAFHPVVAAQSVPLLQRFGIDVVRFGPSEQSEDGFVDYVLVRAFDSHASREEQEARSTGRANGGAVRAGRSSAGSRAITPSCSRWRCTRSTPCALPPHNPAEFLTKPARSSAALRYHAATSPASTLSMKARLVAHPGSHPQPHGCWRGPRCGIQARGRHEEAPSRLLSGRHLGIGLGDRFGASQGESGSFEGGVR
jgi:hypothetical protein